MKVTVDANANKMHLLNLVNCLQIGKGYLSKEKKEENYGKFKDWLCSVANGCFCTVW